MFISWQLLHDIGFEERKESRVYGTVVSPCLFSGTKIKVPVVLNFWIWLRGGQSLPLLLGRAGGVLGQAQDASKEVTTEGSSGVRAPITRMFLTLGSQDRNT